MTLTDLPSTMRAVVMRQFGPPDVLRVEDVPTPTPGDGEVIVKVRSVSVNRTLDVLVRRDGNNRNVKLPAVLGVDPSGVVVATDPGVRQRRVGDRVATVNFRCGECEYCLAGAEEDCRSELRLGISRWGGYAEYVAVPERATVCVPDDIPFANATVFMRHFPTAFALARRADLQPGELALVMGAAGALGGCCVQVAQLIGAHVIAAAGSDDRVAAAVELGAEAHRLVENDSLVGKIVLDPTSSA